jgi:hypothetical protein
MRTYDWRQGAGRAFEYDITRQLVDEDVDDDESEGIWQLRLTAFFAPDEENARLRSGDRWLQQPAGLGEFTDWIAGLPVTAYCAGRRPLRTELDWDEV